MKLGKKRIATIVAVVLPMACFFISPLVALVGVALYMIIIITFAVFVYINKLIKRTNWWNNHFAYTHQFISNLGYRKDLTRNIEVVNVGSNPALFAFDYTGLINGANWATGSQGLDMDYEILRFYHSFLKKGATVILPIVPFSSVSGYLTRFPITKEYQIRFYSILDGVQRSRMPMFKHTHLYMRFPILVNWKTALKSLVKDVPIDRRMIITAGLSEHVDDKDANFWMDKCWKPEFAIKDFNAPLSPELKEGREISSKQMAKTIEFLLERGYKPVLLSPPTSAALAARFTPEIKEIYIYSFVRPLAEKYSIPYLDYTDCKELYGDDLFFNDLFMNVKGRKIFTQRVLKDLNLI